MTDSSDSEIARNIFGDIVKYIQYFSSSSTNMKLEVKNNNEYPADYLVYFAEFSMPAFKDWTEFFDPKDVQIILEFDKFLDTYPNDPEDYLWSFEGINDERWIDIRAHAKMALKGLSRNDKP